VTDSTSAVRLTDILTNAAAFADLQGSSIVGPLHLLSAIDHLTGTLVEMDSPPRSPLGRGGRRAVVVPEVRELARRWFVALGRDPLATLSNEQLGDFKADVETLAGGAGAAQDG